MPIEILMPALSPTMTEGNLAKWVKKEGETVAAGDVIAEIETDKATMEVEAVDEGTIGKILIAEGSEGVPVNKVIALLLEEDEDKKALDSYEIKEEPPAAPVEEEKSEDDGEKAPQTSPAPAAVASGYQATKAPALPNTYHSPLTTHKASPLAKRKANDLGINIKTIVGTGPKGRIIAEDVEAAAMGGGGVSRNEAEFEHLPNSSMRKVVAKRLTESKQQVPHFYLSVDVELDALLNARAQINKKGTILANDDGKPAYKVSVNDMVIKAVSLALRDVPDCNVSYYDDAIVRYNNVDISIAVALDGGLITPIIFNADQKSIPQISINMKDLANRARDGKLQPEEYTGGGFSISNLGMFGVKSFDAIINPPQACILAVGAGEQRAVIKNGTAIPATVMSCTLSVDHRAVDGALGAQFLSAFKGYIENPISMLI